jgi:hypothetical protein
MYPVWLEGTQFAEIFLDDTLLSARGLDQQYVKLAD